MKYTILNLLPADDPLAVVAQAVTEHGMVSRGVEEFLIEPGLDGVELRGAEPGQVWEIEADEQGKVTKAERHDTRSGGGFTL